MTKQSADTAGSYHLWYLGVRSRVTDRYAVQISGVRIASELLVPAGYRIRTIVNDSQARIIERSAAGLANRVHSCSLHAEPELRTHLNILKTNQDMSC